MIRAYVFFSTEDTVLDEKFKCGIQLSAPGPLLYTSSKGDNMLSSLNDSLKTIKNKLQKKKRINKKSSKNNKENILFT